MKKLTDRLRKKKPEDQPKPDRITNETVAEHREQILAGGRKFKYPLQYAKHRLVLNSIAIAVVAIVVLIALGWYLLYVAQSSSKFMYRLTQLVPIPVASVEGQQVRYSDYLKKYRSDIFSLVQQEQINLRSKDGKRQAEYYKRKELDSSTKDAYIEKLAHEKRINVSRSEVEDFITKTVNSKSISLEAYEKTVLENFYDWSLDDYRGIVKDRLLAQKVSFAVDTDAKKRADDVYLRANTAGADFAAIARETSDDEVTKVNGGDVGSLPADSQDINGLIAAAAKMTPGQVSAPIKGTDGYYIIKVSTKDSSNVQYSQIKISLKALDKLYEQVKKSGNIHEYIKVDQQ
jgi:parvulin-like peptidyl-prolyl isomerase